MERQSLPFINPATGAQFGSVDVTTEEEVRAARERLRPLNKEWANRPVAERVRIVHKLRKVIIDNVDMISDVIAQDTGKSRQDALIEVFITSDRLQKYCRHTRRWLRRERIPSGLYIFKRYYTEPQPYGTVGVICPWNYPFDLALPPTVAALLAGNTVLIKPSEVTPAVGELIGKLLQSVPELSPYVQILQGDGRVGAALVDSRPDLVFFTGSESTARKIGRAAAEHMIPFLHELGGKDPMIVLEDADIEAAARWGCWGAYYNAGQSCVAVERVYVVESVYDQFVAAVLARTAEIRSGYVDARESVFDYGPITFERQMLTIERHLDDAVARGARILAGGQRHGSFFEPTVLVDVDHSMLLMREETFGPLLPIMKVGDEAEAIALANDNSYGLSAAVWSQDLRRAERVAHEIEAGSVVINDTLSHYGVPLLPFGGVKNSGNARTHGRSDVLQFTQARSYALGRPPMALDLATIMRLPGNYWLGKAVMKLVFGVTPRQRLEAIDVVAAHLRESNEQEPVVRPAPRRLAMAGGVVAAVALGALTMGRRKERR